METTTFSPELQSHNFLLSPQTDPENDANSSDHTNTPQLNEEQDISSSDVMSILYYVGGSCW